jgi:hypothetical protein
VRTPELALTTAPAASIRSRWIELARAAWGAALLLAPRQVRVDDRSLLVARILGARHLSQAVLSGVDPSPEVLAMGVWVDCAHATTALALAAVDRSRARGGLTDAGVAAVWAAAGYHDLNTGAVPSPRHDRRRDAMARWVLGMVPGGSILMRRSDRHRRSALAGVGLHGA